MTTPPAFCPSCGARRLPAARFCGGCGADLGSERTPLSASMSGRAVAPGVPTLELQSLKPHAGQSAARPRLGRAWLILLFGLLVAGAVVGIGLLRWSSTRVYEGTFSPTGSLTVARYSPSATLLADGRILVVGGWDASNNSIASAELYDPRAGTFSPTGSLTVTRDFPSATLLADGRVLVAGGRDASGSLLASAELFQ